MADATSANYPSLPAGVMRAGYVTGPPDIQWTAAQLATAAVTIDQGYQSPPVTTATVRDAEPGAWPPGGATVRLSDWSASRPTIYCDETYLPGILAAGWQGCLWLAIPGWQTGQALPSAPGCEIVAVQNQQDVNGAYDLSVVLDPTWPEASMPLYIQGPASTGGKVYLLDGGKMHHVDSPADLTALQSGGAQAISPAEEAQLLADFPPGEPTVTTGPVTVTFPTYTSTPS